MIHYTQGNLLDAEVEALVNTVNTVGIMGKGIALMFKEAFPENFRLYAAACKQGEVQIGRMFVTERPPLAGSGGGPRWIINFPTKRALARPHPSRMGPGRPRGFDESSPGEGNPLHRPAAARLRQWRIGMVGCAALDRAGSGWPSLRRSPGL